jgi:hypothetical protein
MEDTIEVDGRIGEPGWRAERIEADYRRKREELAG